MLVSSRCHHEFQQGQSTYNLDILSTAGLEQNQAHMWMLDQDSHDDQVTGLVLWVLVACTAAVGASEEPVQCEIGLDVVLGGTGTYHPASTRMVPRLRMWTFVPSGQRKAGTPAVARRLALVAMVLADVLGRSGKCVGAREDL